MEKFLNTLLPKGTKMIIRFPHSSDLEVISEGRFTKNDSWGVTYLNPKNNMTGAVLADYVYVWK